MDFCLLGDNYYPSDALVADAILECRSYESLYHHEGEFFREISIIPLLTL